MQHPAEDHQPLEPQTMTSSAPSPDAERRPERSVAASVQRALAEVLPVVLSRQGALLSVKDAASGRFLHVNPEMAAFLRHSPEALSGLTDADVLDPVVATALRAAEHTALAQSEPLVSDHRFEWSGLRHDYSVLRMVLPADGDGRRVLCSVWFDQSGARLKESQLRQALDQLEQQQRANESLRRELRDQGLRDVASGLYTRSHFDDQFRRETDLSTREHREFALVLIEVDPLNDVARSLGEPAQARIFEAMGRLLRGNTRAMDASCRIDGPLFAVLLSGVGLATAHSRMEGLRRQCANQIVMLDAQELRFTVSMGVASFPHTAHSQDELLAACESALGEARRRGGNHVTLASIRFDPD
jgi:diguanylate cyclase (GGDEF)-like protein